VGNSNFAEFQPKIITPAAIYPKIEIHDKIRLIRISAIFLVQPDLF